jgi:ketosteroid isomerase-like protein
MSQDNVEVARRAIEGYNEGDLEAVEACWHPDGAIDWSRSLGPFKGVYRGRGEREAFLNEFLSTFVETRFEANGFTEAGTEVVVPGAFHNRARQGMNVTARVTLVVTVENGLITRMRLFQEEADALEAVGLRE